MMEGRTLLRPNNSHDKAWPFNPDSDLRRNDSAIAVKIRHSRNASVRY